MYDTDLDITWLADANVIGATDWYAAVAWADTLEIAGFRDWRLPKTVVPDATCEDELWGGYNCTGSEMGHLFYNGLGGTAGSSILTSGDSALSLFTNIGANRYWSGTPSTISTAAWSFRMYSGLQEADNKSQSYAWGLARLAWAVHDGDVGGTGFATKACD